ncbi:MAG: hypothetical protein ACI3XJ_01215 [Oscillospiraceae bacterium]
MSGTKRSHFEPEKGVCGRAVGTTSGVKTKGSDPAVLHLFAVQSFASQSTGGNPAVPPVLGFGAELTKSNCDVLTPRVSEEERSIVARISPLTFYCKHCYNVNETTYARNLLTHVGFLFFRKMDKSPLLAIEVDGTTWKGTSVKRQLL